MRTSTLPAGSVPAAASLKPGKHTLKITDVRDNDELTVEYPDGWSRAHQAKTMEELAPKIVNNLRARYGATAATITKAPAIAINAIIEVEI